MQPEFINAHDEVLVGPGAELFIGDMWKVLQDLKAKQSRSLAYSAWAGLADLGAEELLAKLKKEPKSASVLLSRRDILEALEKAFENENHKPLAKLIEADAKSRVFVEFDESFGDARSLISEATEILKTATPWISSLFREIIATVVPIYHERNGKAHRRGFSHADFLGIVFTSFAERQRQDPLLRGLILAIDFAHETGHQSLNILQHADSILLSPLKQPVYSSIRKVHRPAIMSFHAGVATAFMIEVCAGVVESESQLFCEAHKAHALNSLREFRSFQSMGLAALQGNCQFTEVGQTIMNELSRQLTRTAGLCDRWASRDYTHRSSYYAEV